MPSRATQIQMFPNSRKVAMKVTLESTSKLVTLIVDGAEVPARIWEGHTEGGIPCHAFITRIAASADQDLSQFERELQERKAPSSDVEFYPLRLIF